MTEYYPPLKIPPERALTGPLIRPFNTSPNCVMALLPEINTTWIDYSNKTNHATKSGNPTIIPGRINQGLHFDGVGDFLTVSDHASIKFATGDFSIAVWFRSTDTSNCDLVEKGPGASFYLVRMLNTGAVYCQVYDGATSKTRTSTLTYNDGNWHQVVTTCDRDALMTLYADGATAVAGIDISGVGDISSANNLLIADDSLSAHYYIGDIDEVLIFNRVLEEWEITALYEQGRPG